MAFTSKEIQRELLESGRTEEDVPSDRRLFLGGQLVEDPNNPERTYIDERRTKRRPVDRIVK